MALASNPLGRTQGEAALPKMFRLDIELPPILDNGRFGGYNAARHSPERAATFEPARDCSTTGCGA